MLQVLSHRLLPALHDCTQIQESVLTVSSPSCLALLLCLLLISTTTAAAAAPHLLVLPLLLPLLLQQLLPLQLRR